jgi:two-component system nitrogen regulation sensor histidine kinase NtrY
MKLTRFEWKILAAIFAVGAVSLLGALVLGTRAMRESYQVGINHQVGDQLEGGLEVYRAYFASMRENAERTADAIANDARLQATLAVDSDVDPGGVNRRLDALLTRYPDVGRISLVLSSTHVVLYSREVSERLDRTRYRLITLERENAGLSISVTISTPAERFAEYQNAGEVAGVYKRLLQNTTYVTDAYLGVYIVFLLVLILLIMAIAMSLSRRVTRRVALVAEATKRVGSGDLSVVLPIESKDEVGELTRAFNDMVRDMRTSRDRIDYLSRVSAWQDFARRLAHEIKNPLTPIQLAVQEVHRRYTGSDLTFKKSLDDARSIIEEEVATLRRLVGEFSSFAKLPEAHLDDADLVEFANEAFRTLAAIGSPEKAGDALVDVRCEAPNGPIAVRIDAMMLKRCVDNLVRNAVQAVRAAGPASGLVVLTVRQEGSNALLEVQDNGSGVAAADQMRVFDPYYTTKADGTGLGLAIVKKVVLEHGGDIECLSAKGGGALFRIRLPLAK